MTESSILPSENVVKSFVLVCCDVNDFLYDTRYLPRDTQWRPRKLECDITSPDFRHLLYYSIGFVFYMGFVCVCVDNRQKLSKTPGLLESEQPHAV